MSEISDHWATIRERVFDCLCEAHGTHVVGEEIHKNENEAR